MTMEPVLEITDKARAKILEIRAQEPDQEELALSVEVAGMAGDAYTYELTVKANGCFVADGPPALVGGRTITTPQGSERVNPLFAFDGCFES